MDWAKKSSSDQMGEWKVKGRWLGKCDFVLVGLSVFTIIIHLMGSLCASFLIKNAIAIVEAVAFIVLNIWHDHYSVPIPRWQSIIAKPGISLIKFH